MTDFTSPSIPPREEGDPSMVTPGAGERQQLANSLSYSRFSSSYSRDLYDLFYTKAQRPHEREGLIDEEIPTKDLVGTPQAALHAVQSFAEANVLHEPFFSNLCDFLLSPSSLSSFSKPGEEEEERHGATKGREIHSPDKEEEIDANTGREDCEAPSSSCSESIVWLDLWKSREICELLLQFRRLGYTSCDELLTYLWSAYDDRVLSRDEGVFGERKKKEDESLQHSSLRTKTPAREGKTRRGRRRMRHGKDKGKDSLLLGQKKVSSPNSCSSCQVERSREGVGLPEETSSSSVSPSVSFFETESRGETRKRKIRLYDGCTPQQLSCLIHMAAYGDVPPPSPKWQQKLITLLLLSSSSSSSSFNHLLPSTVSSVSTPRHPQFHEEDGPYGRSSSIHRVDILQRPSLPFSPIEVGALCVSLLRLTPLVGTDFFYRKAPTSSLPSSSSSSFSLNSVEDKRPLEQSFLSSQTSSVSSPLPSSDKEEKKDKLLFPLSPHPLRSPAADVSEARNRSSVSSFRSTAGRSLDTTVNPLAFSPSPHAFDYEGICRETISLRFLQEIPLSYLPGFCTSLLLHIPPLRIQFPHKSSSPRRRESVSFSSVDERREKANEEATDSRAMLRIGRKRRRMREKKRRSERQGGLHEDREKKEKWRAELRYPSYDSETVSTSPSSFSSSSSFSSLLSDKKTSVWGGADRMARHTQQDVGDKKDLLKDQKRKLGRHEREEEESFLLGSSFSSSSFSLPSKKKRREEDQVEAEDNAPACSFSRYWPRDVRRSLFYGWKVSLARLLDLWKRSAASSYGSLIRHALVYQQLAHPFLGRNKRDKTLLLMPQNHREDKDKEEKKKTIAGPLLSFSSPSSSCYFSSSSSSSCLSQTPSSLSLLATLYLYNPLHEYEGMTERYTHNPGQLSLIEQGDGDEREEEKRRRRRTDEILDGPTRRPGGSPCMRSKEEPPEGQLRSTGRSHIDNEREIEEEREERREDILKGEIDTKVNSDEEVSLQGSCSCPSRILDKKKSSIRSHDNTEVSLSSSVMSLEEVRDSKKKEKNKMLSKMENVSLLSLSSSTSSNLSRLKERQEEEEEKEKEEKEKDLQMSSKRAVSHHFHRLLSSPLFRGVPRQLPVFLTPRWAETDPYLSMLTKKEEAPFSESTQLGEQRKTQEVCRQGGAEAYHRAMEKKAIQSGRQQIQDEKEEERREEVAYLDGENRMDKIEEMKREKNDRAISVSTEVLDTRLSTAARLCRQTLLSLLVYVHLSFSEIHSNTHPTSNPSSTAPSRPLHSHNTLLSSLSFHTSSLTTCSQKNPLSRCSSPVSVSLRSLSLAELRDMYLLTILTTSSLLWADSGPGALGVKARNLPSISKKETEEDVRIGQTSLSKEKKEIEAADLQDSYKVFQRHNRQESSNKREEVSEEEPSSSSSSAPSPLRCTDTLHASSLKRRDSLDQGVHLRVLLQQVLLDKPEEEQRLLRFLRDEKDEEMNEEVNGGARLKGQRRKIRHRRHLKSTLWSESASYALYTASHRLQVAWKEREKEKENALVEREKARQSRLELLLERRRRRGESDQQIAYLSSREIEEGKEKRRKREGQVGVVDERERRRQEIEKIGRDTERREVVDKRDRRREEIERNKIEVCRETVEKEKGEKAHEGLISTGTSTRRGVHPHTTSSSSTTLMRKYQYTSKEEKEKEEGEESVEDSLLSPSFHLSHTEGRNEEESLSLSSSHLPSPLSPSEKALEKSKDLSERSRRTPSSPSADKHSLYDSTRESLSHLGKPRRDQTEDSSPFLSSSPSLSSRLSERLALAETAARSLFFASDVVSASDKKKREGTAPSGRLEIKTSKFQRQVLSSLYAGLQLYQQFQPRSKDLSRFDVSSSSSWVDQGENRMISSVEREERESSSGRGLPGIGEDEKKKRRGSGRDKEEVDMKKDERKKILMELEGEKKEKREIRGVEGSRSSDDTEMIQEEVGRKKNERDRKENEVKKIKERDRDIFNQHLFHSFSIDQEVPIGPYTIDLVVSMKA